MALADFRSLPIEFQQVLDLTQQQHSIEIVPLQELKGGRTGAKLFLVSVCLSDSGRVLHYVLKLDRVDQRGAMNEIECHQLARNQAPAEFARDHIPEIAYQVEQGQNIAIFYTIAGQSLLNYRSLASFERQSQLETIFRATDELLLAGWNEAGTFERGLHPQSLLERWLGYRITSQGRLGNFLNESLHIPEEIGGFVIEDRVYPNPLAYARNASRWGKARSLDAITGFFHGDLNITNILVQIAENEKDLQGYFLIDFSFFRTQMPLLFDQRYLEMSYLLRELERVSLAKWAKLVTQFAAQDTPDPQKAPIELAGSCAVINAGRAAFGEWVQRAHASLADDLWAQFWLAGVAAGLNFCNKGVLSLQERLAGLVFAAAHLSRFCHQFGLPAPAEVRSLDGWIEAAGMSHVAAPAPAAPPVQVLQPKGLPEQATTFIGRQSELAEIARLLESSRLVTLYGAGGIGKTRLALAVAEAQASRYSQGAYFVPLLSLTSPAAIIPAIANAIGFNFSEGRMPQVQLLDYLVDRQLLLVLDNLEHLLVEALASETLSILEAMLAAAPQLTLLVTSRELLRLPQEQAYPVSGLRVGDAQRELVAPDESAVVLFLERAKALQSGFKAASGKDLRQVRELCRIVGGMPLAIELAAAQLRLFSLAEIGAEIQRNLDILDTGLRGSTAERHASIRGVFNATWANLPPEEQRLFARLSVFQGGFDHRAAEQVAQAGVKDLAILMDKSLLQRDERGRFGLHALIQRYAREKLQEAPAELAQSQDRHSRYFQDRLAEAVRRWRERYDKTILDDLKPEADDLLAGWSYRRNLGDWDDTAAYLEDLWQFFKVQGRLPEAMELLCQALQSSESARPPAAPVYRAHWERRLGQANMWLSILSKGEEHFRSAVAIIDRPVPKTRPAFLAGIGKQLAVQVLHRLMPATFIGCQDQERIARREAGIAYEQLAHRAMIDNNGLLNLYCTLRALNLAESAELSDLMARSYASIGFIAFLVGPEKLARSYLARAEAIVESQPAPENLEWVCRLTGSYYGSIGDFQRAEPELTLAAYAAGELGQHFLQETDWTILLFMHLVKGEFDRARDYSHRIGQSARQRGDAGFVAAAQYWEGVVDLQQDRLDEAIALLKESEAAPEEVMNSFDWIILRSALAQAYQRQGHLELARQEVDRASKLISAISMLTNGLCFTGFAATAEVYLALWEEGGLPGKLDLPQLARQACSKLRGITGIYPAGRPRADIYQGCCDWLDGNPPRAMKTWQRGLAAAENLGLPLDQALAHDKIGRHLGAGETTDRGWGRQEHLGKAIEIFTRLAAIYYLKGARRALGPDVASTEMG